MYKRQAWYNAGTAIIQETRDGVLALLAVLEAWSRLLGWYDYAIRHDRHAAWDMAWSQKRAVSIARRHVFDTDGRWL